MNELLVLKFHCSYGKVSTIVTSRQAGLSVRQLFVKSEDDAGVFNYAERKLLRTIDDAPISGPPASTTVFSGFANYFFVAPIS
jgi:hypothetical protein